MRQALLPILAALVVGLATARPAEAADGEARLIKMIRSDPSFKVRMQALRVLIKKMRKQRQASNSAIRAVSDAALKDDHHLVRGLACFSLGELQDRRSLSALNTALRDSSSFVREQAEQALLKVPKSKPLPRKPGTGPRPGPAEPGPRGDLPTLVVSVKEMPGVALPRKVLDRFRTSVTGGVRNRARGRYSVATSGRGKGFHFQSGIAERRVEKISSDKTKITVVVRITVMTSPENYLRHVVTSRASAASSSKVQVVLDRLESRVIEAAVERAVRDALVEIERG